MYPSILLRLNPAHAEQDDSQRAKQTDDDPEDSYIDWIGVVGILASKSGRCAASQEHRKYAEESGHGLVMLLNAKRVEVSLR